MPSNRRLVLARNIAFAAFLYLALWLTIELAKSPSSRARLRSKLPSLPKGILHDNVPDTSPISDGRRVKINPNANSFNRPSSAVAIDDAYLGKRPHVDTEADLNLLVRECRGTYEGIEKVGDVFACLQFFARDEHQYHYLPETQDRASQQDPRRAEYANADGANNTLSWYPGYSPPTETSRGSCAGPIIPYHVYWAGPATWRVELFIKAYFHTQNVPCSQLWLWLDADKDANTVYKFLNSDPIFARFLPLVRRGDIKVMSWNFPTKMPLPPDYDHTDGLGYYPNPGPYNAYGERMIADGIVENVEGQQFMKLREVQMTFFAQAISDAVRFIILHLHGGLYLDMDVLLLRDMRPLLLPKEHNFAERWAAHSHPGDFNTAILSLSANSSLSSYFLRGGVRMGLNFHPRVIGRMAWKDGRDQELLMFETAAFDPIWTEFNGARDGRCTVPCFKDYSAPFKGTIDGIRNEWQSFDGEQLPRIRNESASSRDAVPSQGGGSLLQHQSVDGEDVYQRLNFERSIAPAADKSHVVITEAGDALHSWSATAAEEAALRDAGLVLNYIEAEDRYPPNNRTMENFFRGAWAYHGHNKWTRHPEPNSWLDVIQKAHDRFFAGGVNPYNETWEGPAIAPYNRWLEFV